MIVAFRVIFSMLFLSFILFYSRQRSELKAVFLDKKLLLKFIVSSILIFINWSMFIWGIGQGWHLDVSFGYFMTPLLQVILGVVFLKEKMDAGSGISFILALVAIVYLMIAQGVFPWFSLGISGFFALYGVVKKKISTDAYAGLFIETVFMMPICIVMLIVFSQTGDIAFGKDIWTTLLLIGSGIATTVPMLLYNLAAKKITLVSLGFYQYLSPTGMFLIGVFISHDKVEPYRLISFGLIWLALIIYTTAMVIKSIKSNKSNSNTDSHCDIEPV